MRNTIVTITVQGIDISVISIGSEDYICLTDMVNAGEWDDLIHKWMRSKNTLEYLGTWEIIHNPRFKGAEFDTFLEEAGVNKFNMTPRKWIETTDAIGIISKSGQHVAQFFVS